MDRFSPSWIVGKEYIVDFYDYFAFKPQIDEWCKRNGYKITKLDSYYRLEPVD